MRKKKTELTLKKGVSISLDPQIIDYIDKIANESEKSFSEIVNQILKRSLNENLK